MIRPATHEDVKDHPILKNVTFRGYVAEIDGKVEGIAGYLYEKDILQGFSWKGELSAKNVIKLARVVINLYANADAPIYSIPSTEHEGSERFLQYLGFEPYLDKIYVWDNNDGSNKEPISKHTRH